MKSIILWVCMALLFSGCGVNHHLKRANYHLRMAQAKGAKTRVDTVYKELEVIVPYAVYDTVIDRRFTHDTIYIKHTRYSVKIKYDTLLKREYVRVECKGDTIYVKVPVSVNTTIKEGDSRKWLGVGVVSFLVFLLMAIVVKRSLEKRTANK